MVINILGIPYTVKEVDVIDRECYTIGKIDYIHQTIYIDANIPKEKKEQTLMHEILHGVLDALGEREINEDEQKVQSIASALHQVLLTQPVFKDKHPELVINSDAMSPIGKINI